METRERNLITNLISQHTVEFCGIDFKNLLHILERKIIEKNYTIEKTIDENKATIKALSSYDNEGLLFIDTPDFPKHFSFGVSMNDDHTININVQSSRKAKWFKNFWNSAFLIFSIIIITILMFMFAAATGFLSDLISGPWKGTFCFIACIIYIIRIFSLSHIYSGVHSIFFNSLWTEIREETECDYKTLKDLEKEQNIALSTARFLFVIFQYLNTYLTNGVVNSNKTNAIHKSILNSIQHTTTFKNASFSAIVDLIIRKLVERNYQIEKTIHEDISTINATSPYKNKGIFVTETPDFPKSILLDVSTENKKDIKISIQSSRKSEWIENYWPKILLIFSLVFMTFFGIAMLFSSPKYAAFFINKPFQAIFIFLSLIFLVLQLALHGHLYIGVHALFFTSLWDEIKESMKSESISVQYPPEAPADIIIPLLLLILTMALILYFSHTPITWMIIKVCQSPILLGYFIMFIISLLTVFFKHFRKALNFRLDLFLVGFIVPIISCIYLLPVINPFNVALSQEVNSEPLNLILSVIFFATLFIGSLLSAILIGSIQGSLPKSILGELRYFRPKYKMFSYYRDLSPSEDTKMTTFFTSIYWLANIPLVLVIYAFTFSILENLVRRSDPILNFKYSRIFINNIQISLQNLFNLENQQIDSLCRLILFLYVLPFVLFLIMVIYKMLLDNFRTYSVHKNSLVSACDRVLNVVNSISSFANIKAPHLSDYNLHFGAKSLYIDFPYFKDFILINESTLKELNDNEINVLLAHEIGHIKQHTRFKRLLQVVSKLTFTGASYLLLFIDSYRIEFEADRFAKRWMKQKNIPDEVFFVLLDKIQRLKKEIILSKESETGDFGFSDSYIDRAAKSQYSQPIPFLQRIKDNFKAFIYLFFCDKIISTAYIYPSIEERKEYFTACKI